MIFTDSDLISTLSRLASDGELQSKIRGIISPASPAELRQNAESAADAEKDDASSAKPASTPQTIKSGKALLLAMKPYLDDNRRRKIDKILDAMRLAEYAQIFKTIV